MPSHIKTYDGSEDPEDHLKIFQAAAKIERWAMPTWCHMFNSTLTGNVRVWFDDLLAELIDSYDDLKKAFLENYLQKKYIKDLIELHNIKQQDGESTKDFVRRYKLESSGSLESRAEEVVPTVEATRGQSEAKFQERKFLELAKAGKEAGPPKATKKGETSGKDKALTILMVQPWERVVRQTITQSFSLNPEILFPPLGEDEGTEGPMIIEAEIGGHCRHRMYVDGGSASEILYEHCFSRHRSEIKKQLHHTFDWIQRRDNMVNRTNTTTGND
ncbi:reverse transcriptase domain-containing protein [Tanacetum coccineum]